MSSRGKARRPTAGGAVSQPEKSVPAASAPPPQRPAWGPVQAPTAVNLPSSVSVVPAPPSANPWQRAVPPAPSEIPRSNPETPSPNESPRKRVTAAVGAENPWQKGKVLDIIRSNIPSNGIAGNVEVKMKELEIKDQQNGRSADSTPATTPRPFASSSSPSSSNSSSASPRKACRSSSATSSIEDSFAKSEEQFVVKEEINPKLTVVSTQPAELDASSIRPLRPNVNGATKLQGIRVRANHFPVIINPKRFPATVYHYDVVITPREAREVRNNNLPELYETTVPDRLLHEIWKKFEEEFWEQLGARMPFDGKKNCYTVKPLDLGGNTVWSEELRMRDPDDDDKMRSFRIQLKFANEVSTSIMWDYLKSCVSWKRVELPQEVIQALDVGLRYSPSINYTPCNRSFYSSESPHMISNLLELWFGHNQSLLLGRDQKATLNIDMANKAFIKKLPVVKLFEILLRKRPEDMDKGKWDASHYKNANDFLKGKLLQYGTGKKSNKGEYEKKHRFICVDVVQADAATYKFKVNGVFTTIQNYFRDEKGVELKHPNWPVVHVGNKNMTNYVPLELLEILPQAYKGKLEARDTSEMIKGAARPPNERFLRIQNSRDRCGFENCPILRDFGMTVEPKMVEINAKRLRPPQLHFVDDKGRKIIQNPKDSDGKFIIGKFLEPAQIPQVAVMNVAGKFSANNLKEIKTFMDQLGAEATSLGMITKKQGGNVRLLLANARIYDVRAKPVRSNLDELRQRTNDELQKIKRDCEKDVLVIALMGKDGNEYATIKAEAEVQVGVLTQCIKWGTVEKVVQQRGAKQVLINILLKINAKLRGKSFTLGPEIISQEYNFLAEPILFLGADVTHPAPNSKSPSIAAITANYDLTGMCYQMHIQLQPQSGTAQEVIANLAEIIKRMINTFNYRTKRWPKRIIMFRDGVSEGQFSEIKKKEFGQGIQAACQLLRQVSADFNPKLTFLVVKKRHHTRFVPCSDRDGVRPKGNIPPGTVVDTDITHPTEIEFFLNSHVGIQGTSKPTRYHVIHDDCNFTMEQLEKLTYYLCYTFVRCTQPVSYPAPTYYAHLAAFRARALIENEGENVDIDYLRSKMMIHQDLAGRYPMFFV